MPAEDAKNIDQRSHADLPRACSLVLEGGVTSAVVYAGLIARLARRFERFEQLGGTSAGAVAAAFAALAERARREGHGDAAFAGIDRLPRVLSLAATPGGPTLLRRLFQPQPGTRATFNILLAALEAWNPTLAKGAVARAVLQRVLREYPWAALTGALPGALLLRLGLDAKAGAWAAGVAVAVAVAGALVVALGWAAVAGLRAIRANHHGLCTGMPVDAPHAVTGFLHRAYNKLLGRRRGDTPAVFAELWGDVKPGPGSIDLQVITSVVTLQRPLRITGEPGADPLGRFFYDPDEWRAFFPAPVMDWLAAHARPANDVSLPGRALRRLPLMPALPIVVAVRMSLSFPILFSALPMFVADDAGGARRVYFADGGLTSNCPVHLFDKPLPTNPTFTADLRDIETPPAGMPVVWIDGDAPRPTLTQSRPDGAGWFNPLVDFAADLLGTSKDWRDTLVRELPGHAERTLNIGLTREQGGLNLAMPERTIARLGALGREGAERLIAAYLGPRTQGAYNHWDRHRWLRLRSTLSAIAGYADELEAACAAAERPAGGALGYEALAACPRPPGDAFANAASVRDALRMLRTLRALARQREPFAQTLAHAPRPRAHLRLTHPW
jgi:predicted acylesterase/phospholipase RssA